MLDKECQLLIDKAKISLFSDKSQIFIMTVLFGLKIHKDEDIESIGVSNKGIFINPEYIKTRDKEEVKADLVHETYHIVFDHIERYKYQGLDAKKYNYAADHLINNMIDDEIGEIEIDDTFLMDKKYRDWDLKSIYDDIEVPEDYIPDILESDEEVNEEALNNIESLITRARMTSIIEGQYDSVPEALRIGIDALYNPKISWQEQLQRFFSSYDRQDSSWRKPERRYLPNMYLPSRYSVCLESLSIYIDCSGSIVNEDYTRFLTEVQEIIDILNPKDCKVYNWGTELADPVIIENSVPILMQTKLECLGGTEINNVINNINETEPRVSIIFTDGYFECTVSSKEEVLWVIYDSEDFNEEFGEVVYYGD